MEGSWNYIAPSRTQVIQWIIEAWEGPKSKVTISAIKKGARICYIDNSLDEAMSAWDNCKKPEDFDVYDWKEEVAKLSEAQRLALFHSPLGANAEKEDREDSVDSQVYDVDHQNILEFQFLHPSMNLAISHFVVFWTIWRRLVEMFKKKDNRKMQIL